MGLSFLSLNMKDATTDQTYLFRVLWRLTMTVNVNHILKAKEQYMSKEIVMFLHLGEQARRQVLAKWTDELSKWQ